MEEQQSILRTGMWFLQTRSYAWETWNCFTKFFHSLVTKESQGVLRCAERRGVVWRQPFPWLGALCRQGLCDLILSIHQRQANKPKTTWSDLSEGTRLMTPQNRMLEIMTSQRNLSNIFEFATESLLIRLPRASCSVATLRHCSMVKGTEISQSFIARGMRQWHSDEAMPTYRWHIELVRQPLVTEALKMTNFDSDKLWQSCL